MTNKDIWKIVGKYNRIKEFVEIEEARYEAESRKVPYQINVIIEIVNE